MSYLLNSETSGSNQSYGYQPSQQSYGYQPSQQSSYGGYQPSQQQSYGGGYQPSQPQQQSYGYVPQQQQQQQAYQQPPAYNPSYQPQQQQQQHQQQSYTPSYQQYQQQQQQQRQPQQQAYMYHQPPPASVASSMASSAPVVATTKSPGDISLTVVGTRPSGAQTTVKLEVDPNDTTLGDITEMIADEIGILPERQLIKYKNKNLDSRTLTLKKLKMPDNSQLAVSVKPPKQQTQATGAHGHRPIGQQQAGAGNAGYRAEFDKMDTDRSGYIDEKELRRVFMGWAPNSLIKKAMAMADTNRDGKISFDEYCVIRTKLGGGKK